jgi:hypothetical protein
MATDGYSDNVFRQSTLDLIKRSMDGSLEDMAELLLESAAVRSTNKQAVTPFQVNAEKSGFFWEGGKSDDITVRPRPTFPFCFCFCFVFWAPL